MASIQESTILPWKAQYGVGQKLRVHGSLEVPFSKIVEKSVRCNYDFVTIPHPILKGDTYDQAIVQTGNLTYQYIKTVEHCIKFV